ncbi:hypothetical protein COCSADRAFT_39404 [Bipolaris sorokiniana ND90Pr]|uniref:Uncharacterized protein n=1 Tax=Cochliobolus sativus (strain ND90Pr / ATCC 201652) TaxID=665912 RepID=M2S3G2_COCSN|nr:uncharacterized protein COCSADRAFT_39404 [Bipolaris sorokiniana ND90Pr]EMD61708.1 hypothetical protein COCSADRAFT_39404 [Bipolaris sorokiniana ND90Pr]
MHEPSQNTFYCTDNLGIRHEERRINTFRPKKGEASKADFPTLPRFQPKSSTSYRVITCIILAPVYTTVVCQSLESRSYQ